MGRQGRGARQEGITLPQTQEEVNGSSRSQCGLLGELADNAKWLVFISETGMIMPVPQTVVCSVIINVVNSLI